MNQKIISNKAKHLLVTNELKKLQTFDRKFYISENHFEEVGVQNSLVFQPMQRYFKKLLVLVVVIIFICGSLKDCLIKELIILLRLSRELLQK